MAIRGFHYFTIVPAEPWDERSLWPVQLAEEIDEIGDEQHDSRLTGLHLEITDGGRTPNPSVSRPSVFRSRLRLIASEEKNSEYLAFYVAKDLMSCFKPGDMLHMVRTSCAGLGLSLLRESQLVFAVGAVSRVPLGDDVQADTPWALVREAESVFRRVDPKFRLRGELPLQISTGGHSHMLYSGPLELGEYLIWVEHGFVVDCIPGEDECAAIALKGACGDAVLADPGPRITTPAIATAQLLKW